MKKILFLFSMLPLLWQEAGAQLQDYSVVMMGNQDRRLVNNPLHDPVVDTRNVTVAAGTNVQNSTIHRTITNLGDIAEGQLYQFKVNSGDPRAYPANHVFMNGFKITNIFIPEKSGIRSFNVAMSQIVATLDTKDRYGDYSQEVDMITDKGVVTFVIKARIVDAGVLKAAADKREAQ